MPSKSELLKLVSVKESLENYTQNCQYCFSLKYKILGYFQYEQTIYIYLKHIHIYVCVYIYIYIYIYIYMRDSVFEVSQVFL